MTRTRPSLTAGWTVELLGLANTVEFRHTGGAGVHWTDGRWYMTHGAVSCPAPGIPAASDMTTARLVGTAFIAAAASLEDE